MNSSICMQSECSARFLPTYPIGILPALSTLSKSGVRPPRCLLRTNYMRDQGYRHRLCGEASHGETGQDSRSDGDLGPSLALKACSSNLYVHNVHYVLTWAVTNWSARRAGMKTMVKKWNGIEYAYVDIPRLIQVSWIFANKPKTKWSGPGEAA